MGRRPTRRLRPKPPEQKEALSRAYLAFASANGLRVPSSDVASHFGISRSALWSAFESMDDLLDRAVSYGLSGLSGLTPYLSDRSVPYMTRFAVGTESAFLQRSSFSRLLLDDLLERRPELRLHVDRAFGRSLRILTDLYAEAVATAVFLPVDPFSMALSDWCLFGALSDGGLADEYGTDAHAVLQNHFRVKLAGLLPPGSVRTVRVFGV